MFGKRLSLHRDYIIFSALIVVVVVVLLVATSVSIFVSQSRNRNAEYAMQTDIIDRVLTESLDSVSQILRFVGQQIVQTPADVQSITKILKKNAADSKIQTLLSWTVYDWISPQNQILINSTHGILRDPVLSNRSHLSKTNQIQGKLFFSDPNIGLVSKQLVIPAGMGIKNNSGQFIGTINIGILVSELTERIEQALNAKKINFILLSKDNYKIIAESYGNNVPLLNTASFAHELGYIASDEKDSGMLLHPIHYGTREYNYYRDATSYPFIILVGTDEITANAEFWQVTFPRMIEISFMGLFSIILLYYFRKRIVNPIVSLARTAEQISRQQLHVDIPKGNYYEVSLLAEKLEEIQHTKKELTVMQEAEKIARINAEKAQLALKKANASLETKVQKRTAKLQEALNSKDEFLNNMSHEIRIPIGCIMGRAEMLSEDWDMLDNEAKKKELEEIYANSKRLFELLCNLLDLARSKAGKMTYDMEPHDLVQVVKQGIDELEILAVSKGLEIHFENQVVSATVLMDTIRIAQVIRNLLGNAIKFTAGGVLTITLRNAPLKDVDARNVPGIMFILGDQGIGVPEEELGSIFDVFTQSSKTKTRAGGSGLGLSVCREIITAHHGIIWAENNGEGPGSTFSFILPLILQNSPVA